MDSFRDVSGGDILCHVVTGTAYQVSATVEVGSESKILLLTRTIYATNPQEWLLVGKVVNFKKED